MSITISGGVTITGGATIGAGGSSSSPSPSGVSDGYHSGGNPVVTNMIQKFSFSSDGNATDVGDLTLLRDRVTGQSSSVSGYTSGWQEPSYSNVIDKFPFASNGNATDVGDLITSVYVPSGQQY